MKRGAIFITRARAIERGEALHVLNNKIARFHRDARLSSIFYRSPVSPCRPLRDEQSSLFFSLPLD